jgi:hypothetical protein
MKQGHFVEAGKTEIRERKPKRIKCLNRGQTLNFGKLLANVTYKGAPGDNSRG